MDEHYRIKIVLSIHRALLGAIMPQMRRIDACWNDHKIFIRIVIDCQIDDSISDEATAIEAEVEADFYPVRVRVIVETITVGNAIPHYQPFEGASECVFSRKE